MELNYRKRPYPDDVFNEDNAYPVIDPTIAFHLHLYQLENIKKQLSATLNGSDESQQAIDGSDESDSFKNKQELLNQYYCHQVFNPSIHTVIDENLYIGDELRMMVQEENLLPTLMAVREPPPKFQRKKSIPKNSPPDLPSTSGGINEKNKKLFFPSHEITSRIYPIIDVDKNKKYIPHIDQTNDAFFPWNKSKHAKQLQPIPIIEYTMEKYNEDIDKQCKFFGLDEDEDASMMNMMQTENDLD